MFSFVAFTRHFNLTIETQQLYYACGFIATSLRFLPFYYTPSLIMQKLRKKVSKNEVASSKNTHEPGQGLGRNMHWNSDMVLVKQTSGAGFQWHRPQIMSGHRRSFNLQYCTGYKEVEVDLSGHLGMCIPTWVRFCLLRRKGHPSISIIVKHSG
jgi:hypothetical protein